MKSEHPKWAFAFFSTQSMKIAGYNLQVVYDESLKDTPAKVRFLPALKEATIMLHPSVKELPIETRMFMLLHELGHVVLNTGDELKVDAWAFKQYNKLGYSLEKAVLALSSTLNGIDEEEHSQRIKRQFYRAKHQAFLKGKISVKQFLKQKI